MKKKIFGLLAVLLIMQVCAVSALTIGSVTSTPQEVQPGEQITLKLEVENNLDEDIENVLVRIILDSTTNPVPFAPYQSSNEYKIDEISEGHDEEAKFDLIALQDAESGTYTVPVEVSYDTSNGTIELGLISLTVNAKPKIELSSDEPFLIRGAKEKITVKIVNSGMGESKFLSVKLKPVSGLKQVGTDKVYIGNIDSNDFDSVDFEVFVNANSPSSVEVPLEVIYSDSMNNEITETKTVVFKTYSQEEAVKLGIANKNNSLLIILPVAAIGLAFFIYRKAKKRKKNKRDNLQ